MIFKIGDVFEERFILDQDTYIGFIQLFNDKNPLHTNEEFAISKGFQGKVMHGNILNGYVSFFIGECLPIKDVIIHLQEIEFKNAAYLNEELLFKAKVTGIYESVDAIEFKYVFTNATSKKIAKGKFQIGILK